MRAAMPQAGCLRPAASRAASRSWMCAAGQPLATTRLRTRTFSAPTPTWIRYVRASPPDGGGRDHELTLVVVFTAVRLDCSL